MENPPNTVKGPDIRRLEQQIDRLRGRLADAWDRGCSTVVIHRLELGLRRRWQRLDKARHLLQ